MIKKIVKKIRFHVQREYSKMHAYDYESTTNGWNKYDGVVLGDKQNIYFDPYVYVHNDLFYMYVSHRNTGNIEYYESDDGKCWSNRIIALAAGEIGEWDQNVSRGCVLFVNNRYYMWYTGQSNSSSSIGVAISDDGKLFKRMSSTPVLSPSLEYEKNAVMNPCVLWDSDEAVFKMWYSAGDMYEPDVICYAVSVDGLNWIKHNNNPILRKGDSDYDKYKVGGCDVHKNTSGYVMYYIGYQTLDNARICEAFSKDGINNWERSIHNPIISPSKGKWDAHAVYKPSVCKHNGKLWLWYNGRTNRIERIGLAWRNLKDDK